MTTSTTQHRIMTRLVAAIYGIIDAIAPVIETVARQPARPWIERDNLTKRFYAIIRELLALTIRIRPGILRTNPTFQSPLPRKEGWAMVKAPSTDRRPAQPRPISPHPATPGLNARQLAQRLATLLRQLECLVAEARTALPSRLLRHAAQARTIAGCNALPAPQPYASQPYASRAYASWERAG